MRGLAALGFDGANVTIPHKAAAVALCDELGGEARDAGAVNTLSFSAAGGARRSHRRPRAVAALRRGARARAWCSAPAAARARPPPRCCGRARAG